MKEVTKFRRNFRQILSVFNGKKSRVLLPSVNLCAKKMSGEGLQMPFFSFLCENFFDHYEKKFVD